MDDNNVRWTIIDFRPAQVWRTIASPLRIYNDLFFMYLVDEEKIYLRVFELKSNFVPVLSYASRGKLGPIIEGLRYTYIVFDTLHHGL